MVGLIPAVSYVDLLRKRKECDSSRATSVVNQLPPNVIGSPFEARENVNQCKCRQSFCLKLYFECFNSGIYCYTFCTCINCKNNDFSPENESLRSWAVLGTLEKNKHSFRPKKSSDSELLPVKAGT